MKPRIDWTLSCGRCCLLVDGFVVAMETDPTYWTGKMIKACAESKLNTVEEIAGTLYVNGFAAARYGDKCRDAKVPEEYWQWSDLKAIAARFNKPIKKSVTKRKA